jgi:hypothetical protein
MVSLGGRSSQAGFIFFVFPDASAEIAGDTDIKAVQMTAHDIDPSAFGYHPGR